ncbi:MAG TPA: hypothetical protein K8U84_09610 [Paenalcaligenes hominis]|uniref:Transmembrane protein n=1 Tax=Paenalcaligenes hominis TaxID=643674 RepID=A0A9D2VHH4_9BURK|nr:BPSS1780 family membrane protein [Paenalcaligenes hominis]NJB64382.1 hypothetical protein [Paenalcaligenes hominis]GGE68082.1 hypothetical protein GCM10007278_15210 [Paenalcaligenes hominis]HJH24797.1 hypothetical protein [Paenalcaligenes hominis]
MQAARLSAEYGWAWLVQGWALFKRQPMTMLFWSLMTSLLINLSYLIPIFGQIALIIATPAIGFIALNACVQIERNQPMQLGMWLQPLKDPNVKKAMLKLGISYFFVCLAAGFLAVMPFSQTLMDVMSRDEADPALVMQAIQAPMYLFGLFYAGISILFWHAPALMGWHGIPLKKALFYSMVACWRTKGALLIFGLCWAAIYFGAQYLAKAMVAVFGSSFAYFLLTPLNLFMMAYLYSCFYPIYRSVFGQSAIEPTV